eukprot:c18527_g1_i3.p1 GENE.c18527_g1_i3~~c18527_g1_i3.p1  ORF type:complete len:353 (+),score=74.86 c18527_g1_i3:87-1145(+)
MLLSPQPKYLLVRSFSENNYYIGEVIDENDSSFFLKTNENVEKWIEKENTSIILPEDISGVDDLKNISHPHDVILIENLKRRFDQGIYTTLLHEMAICINPFIRNESNPLYNDKLITQFIDQRQTYDPANENFLSHHYQIAENAHLSLCYGQYNQSIIIVGESNSGKSEICKSLIDYYCRSSLLPPLVEEDLNMFYYGTGHVFAILESFCNARTEFSNNSTRAAKLIKFKYNNSHEFIGTTTEIWLFESSRISSPPPKEGNFHIFSEAIFGCLENTEIQDYIKFPGTEFIASCKSFEYLKNTNLSLEKSRNGFEKLMIAFKALNFSFDELKDILKIVIGILYIGNIQFKHVT